jgi:hypothetical protein
MKTAKLVGMIVVVGGLLVIFLCVYFYLRTDPYTKAMQKLGVDSNAIQQTIRANKDPQGLPEELTTKFDPTKDPVVFRVAAMDPTNGSFTAVGMSPGGWVAHTFTTKITCLPWDLRYTPVGSNVSQYVVPGQLMGKIETLDNRDVVVSGKCGDSQCAEIKAECQVRVFPGATK